MVDSGRLRCHPVGVERSRANRRGTLDHAFRWKLVRILAYGLVLGLSVLGVTATLPQDRRVSVYTNMSGVYFFHLGPRTDVAGVTFRPVEGGGALLTVDARGTDWLGVAVDARIDSNGLMVRPPACVAVVGECVSHGTGEPVPGVLYFKGAETRPGSGVFHLEARILPSPSGGPPPYVASTSIGYVEVAVPRISAAASSPAVQLNLSVELPDTEGRPYVWSANPPAEVENHAPLVNTWATWHGFRLGAAAEPVQLRASGVVPAQLDADERSSFIAGVLVGVAGAAALAIIPEVLPLFGPRPLSVSRVRIRPNRAGRLRR